MGEVKSLKTKVCPFTATNPQQQNSDCLGLDALYGQFERLTAANERLTDMLGRVANLEKPDTDEAVEGQKKLGDYVR